MHAQRGQSEPGATRRADGPGAVAAAPARGQRGAVLLIVMLVMMGLLGLGLTALWLTSGNLQIGANLNQRTQALYVAEAGVARARAALNLATQPQVSTLLGGAGHALRTGQLAPNHNDEIPASVNANGQPLTAGGLPARGALFVDGGVTLDRFAYPAGTLVPRAQIMGTYTVFVRNDNAEIRKAAAGVAGFSYTIDNDTSVLVRSEGVAVDGRTTVVLEVALGGAPGSGAVPPVAGAGPVLGYSGKNSQDDNNSVVAGIVAN